MLNWDVNAVRVPLNEACWNGESYVNPAYAGANYQSAIEAYVHQLNANGLVAILDLHWTDGAYTGPSAGCSSAQAVCQKPMPDAAQAIPFWTSVANAFKGNDAVILEMFNEPFPDGNQDTVAGWTCWRDGGTCAGQSYQAAGMQTLVNAVRATGATNVIALGGLQYSNALSQWLTFKPTDPLSNLAAAWHVYNFNLCNNVTCYDSRVGVVAAQVPVLATEIGDSTCDAAFLNPLMNWLDARQTGYLAWTWDTWGAACGAIARLSGPPPDSGTPTTFGQIYKTHLGLLP